MSATSADRSRTAGATVGPARVEIRWKVGIAAVDEAQPVAGVGGIAVAVNVPQGPAPRDVDHVLAVEADVREVALVAGGDQEAHVLAQHRDLRVGRRRAPIPRRALLGSSTSRAQQVVGSPGRQRPRELRGAGVDAHQRGVVAADERVAVHRGGRRGPAAGGDRRHREPPRRPSSQTVQSAGESSERRTLTPLARSPVNGDPAGRRAAGASGVVADVRARRPRCC